VVEKITLVNAGDATMARRGIIKEAEVGAQWCLTPILAATFFSISLVTNSHPPEGLRYREGNFFPLERICGPRDTSWSLFVFCRMCQVRRWTPVLTH
jgi:hypothetical protein